MDARPIENAGQPLLYSSSATEKKNRRRHRSVAWSPLQAGNQTVPNASYYENAQSRTNELASSNFSQAHRNNRSVDTDSKLAVATIKSTDEGKRADYENDSQDTGDIGDDDEA